MKNLILVLTFFAPGFPVWAQSELRADEIEAERQSKLQQLAPDQPTLFERRMERLQNNVWTRRVLGAGDGLRFRPGGLAQAQGFAVGATYTDTGLAGGRVAFRASARGSTRGAYLADFGVAMPRLAGGRAFVDLYGLHYNYPNMQFYGEGPKSSKNGRSVYRLENTSVEVRSGLRLLRRGLTVGLSGGYQAINVGRGDNRALGRTEQVYSDAQAPGLARQSSFLQGGGYLQYDWRGEGTEPTSGGLYKAAWLRRYLPLDKFAVDQGRLRFEDLFAKHEIGKARAYSVAWAIYDNRRSEVRPIEGATDFSMPAPVLELTPGQYAAATIRYASPSSGEAESATTVYLRRELQHWQPVGIERKQ